MVLEIVVAGGWTRAWTRHCSGPLAPQRHGAHCRLGVLVAEIDLQWVGVVTADALASTSGASRLIFAALRYIAC